MTLTPHRKLGELTTWESLFCVAWAGLELANFLPLSPEQLALQFWGSFQVTGSSTDKVMSASLKRTLYGVSALESRVRLWMSVCLFKNYQPVRVDMWMPSSHVLLASGTFHFSLLHPELGIPHPAQHPAYNWNDCKNKFLWEFLNSPERLLEHCGRPIPKSLRKRTAEVFSFHNDVVNLNSFLASGWIFLKKFVHR